MMHLHLKDLRFHCHHGLYDDEALTGGEFMVNTTVGYQPMKTPVVSIHETVDYTKIYELIKLRMSERTLLLETLATEIAASIFQAFSLITEIHISIEKLHPPIKSFQGSVGVSYQVKRSEI
jgi:7,8-dihydroneopterin aldolase/epimerase/oxygenase